MKYAMSALTILLALSFTSIGFPGEKYRWYIIKGKDGVCKVIQAWFTVCDPVPKA